ncbi:hypothetical protein HDU76_010920 [Blyttiomyces sp. JEL0837]|nr:hypothetical protein HDU76_010920 [Blyttiomyces sp. JEL0837]
MMYSQIPGGGGNGGRANGKPTTPAPTATGPTTSHSKRSNPFTTSSIFSDSLRQALSPFPFPGSTAATSSSQHGLYQAPLSLSGSSEEIWKESPPDSPKVGGGKGRRTFDDEHDSEEAGGLLKGRGPASMTGHGKSGAGKLRDYDDGNDDEEDEDEFYAYGEAGRLKIGRPSELAARRKQYALAAVAAGGLVLLLVIIIIIAVLSNVTPPSIVPPESPLLLLISMDGLRSDYLSRGLTPHLDWIAKQGVRAKHLTPSFPSVTFPNHYTIVTGLYPESHGIVGNVFFDPVLNDTFVYVDPKKNTNGKWWGGEPIWVTAQKQGLRSATCMWPGSEAPIGGVYPTYGLKFNATMSLDEKSTQILSWLDLPSESRPHFLTLYVSDIDHAGHMYGPNSTQVNQALVSVDEMMGKLVGGLKSRGLLSKINLMIVSDHGMADAAVPERYIFLDDFIDTSRVHVINNLVVFVQPKYMNELDPIFIALKKASLTTGHFQVWKTEDVPEYLHFSKNSRIGPIVILPDLDWAVTIRQGFDLNNLPKGMHGYNNTFAEMRAIFIAAGPAFKSSHQGLPTLGHGHLPTDQQDNITGNITGNITNSHGGAAVGGSLGHDGHQNVSAPEASGDPNYEIRDGDPLDGIYLMALAMSQASSSNNSVEDLVDTSDADVAVSSATTTGGGLPPYMPAFQNIQIYNLMAHVLGIVPAPNNGTVEGFEVFKPWLNY